jgi:hypothetical protein
MKERAKGTLKEKVREEENISVTSSVQKILFNS